MNGFNGKWRHLQGQLDAEFNRWTADAIRTGFIYGHLFQAIKDAGAAITQLHQDQAIELEHAGENAVFGAKVESDAATVRAMLTAIHDKTKSIENVPTTANGLPLRP